MHDPYAQEIIDLLALASDIKARLRDMESDALDAARKGEAVDGEEDVRKHVLTRARNHLELAVEALGAPKGSFTGAGGLNITGFHSAKVLDDIRSEKEQQAGGLGEVTPPHPVEPSGEKLGNPEPGKWVKNRVDEIQRALTAAFGEDDLFGEDEPAAPAPPPEPVSQPEFIGNTATLSVPELVGFFQLQEKTGVLTIDARQEQFKLEYLKGELIHAGSSSSPPGERLGEILIQLGHLTEQSLAQLLSEKQGGERLGDVVRRGDLITEEALAQALQVQVQRIFHRLFDVGGCRFVFREGLEGEPSERVRYNITRLLLETARHRDEQKLAG